MKEEEVKIGMKVLIPIQKNIGHYKLDKFLIALNASNPLNQDHLYVIHRYKPFFREQQSSYTLGFTPASGTNDSVNGYKIGEFEFLAEDLVAYDNPDDIKPEVEFVAGQPIHVDNPEPINSLEGDSYQEPLDKTAQTYIDTVIKEGDEKITELYRELSEVKKHKDWEMGQPELVESSVENGNRVKIPVLIESKGLRFNEGKLDYSLMDLTAFSPMIEVLEFGAKKYSRDNWKSGGEKWGIMGIFSSILRHTALLLSGQLYDNESGLSHIGHIQCNIMFLGYFWNKHLADKKAKKKSTFLKDLPKQK